LVSRWGTPNTRVGPRVDSDAYPWSTECIDCIIL
jgi:hypothetical protein